MTAFKTDDGDTVEMSVLITPSMRRAITVKIRSKLTGASTTLRLNNHTAQKMRDALSDILEGKQDGELPTRGA